MKEIAASRKLLGATPNMPLKQIEVLYKGLMKKHHPDRFQDELERIEAEQLSQQIIAAYKFLQGIHPETHAARTEEFEANYNSGVLDWEYKGQILSLHFADGSKHAFYGVSNNTYNKFVATNGTPRFVRRNLVGSFLQRRLNGPTGVLAA